MVAYLKATTNKNAYSDYLQVVLEAEKEETIETSCSWVTASTSKPRATSFFPLWKLKGSQPAITLSVPMVHLEENSTDEEEGINSEEPDGIRGMTEELIV